VSSWSDPNPKIKEGWGEGGVRGPSFTRIYNNNSMEIPKEIVTATIALTDQYFDLQGLCVYSSIPVSTLRDYLRKQNLPHFKTRGKILVKRSEFDTWLETYRVNRAQDLKELTNSIMNDLRPHRIHY